MPGFGIQKRGTSPLLVKRKGFSEGSYPLVDEVPEPKMERMPSNEDKDYTPKKERMPSNDNKDYTPKKAKISSDDNEYFTKETRVGKNQYKVERVKKSDDEEGYSNKKFARRLGKAKGGQAKVSKVMREFGKGKLHSGKKGPVVKSRKQAIAIALSEAGMSKKKKK
jgi:hypothetical protein